MCDLKVTPATLSKLLLGSEGYLGPCQTSLVELFSQNRFHRRWKFYCRMRKMFIQHVAVITKQVEK